MRTPSAETVPVAWISTRDRHLAMDEIRAIARSFRLTWRLSQFGYAECDTADDLKRFGRLDFLTQDRLGNR